MPDQFYNSYSMQLVTNKINDQVYRLCATSHLTIPNDIRIKTINVNLISFINDGYYTIRVYNFTEKTILNEVVFSNTIRQINTVNINVPGADSIIEIHVKVNSDINFAIIDSAQINLYVAN